MTKEGRFLAASGFKDVVCEVVRDTQNMLVIQWWNVSPSFEEPFPMGRSSTTLAMETIAKTKIRNGEWALFETLEDAQAYVLKGRPK